MALSDFKALSLREIRQYRDNIQRFIDETYSAAESAVENLFSDTSDHDVLKNLDDLNRVLKLCREKLAIVNASLPFDRPAHKKDEVEETKAIEQKPEQTPIISIATAPCKIVDTGIHDRVIEALPTLPRAEETQTIDVQQPERDLPPSALQVQVHKVLLNEPYLVEVLSPGTPARFWIKLAGSRPEKIESELTRAYISCPSLTVLPQPGTFVICYVDTFCRGKVITQRNFASKPSHAEVMLIDRGEVITAPVNQLYPIKEEFCIEPAVGLLCSLKDLDSQDWGMEEMSYFLEQCQQSETLTAFFLSTPQGETFSKHSPDFYIRLEKQVAGRSVDIGTFMMENAMGKSSQENYRSASNPTPSSVPKTPAHSTQASEKTDSRPFQAVVAYSAVHQVSPEIPVYPAWSRGESTQTVPFKPAVPLDCQKPKMPSTPSVTNPAWTKPSEQPSRATHSQGSSTKLNVNAPEFVLPQKAAQPAQSNSLTSRSSQNDKKVNRSRPPSRSTGRKSADSKASRPSGSTPSRPIEVVPPFSSNDRITPIPFKPAVGDDAIDELLNPPSCMKDPDVMPSSEDPEENFPEEEPYRRPTDQLLLQEFLNSLRNRAPERPISAASDAQTFVTASTHISLRTESSCSNITIESQSRPLKMDYDYGAVLNPRPPLVSESQELPTVTITMASITSPTWFYGHLVKDHTLLATMVDRLNRLYKESTPVPVTRPEVGSFWVYKENMRDMWSRCEVICLHEDASKQTISVTVLAVDWGFLEVIDLSQLRPLVHNIKDMPSFAICFRLAGIYPLNENLGSEDWSDEAVNMFIHYSNSAEQFRILVDPRSFKDNQLSVIMFPKDDHETYSINEMLVRLELASSAVYSRMRETVVKDDEILEQDLPLWDPMAKDFESHFNTLALNTKNYDSVSAGYIPKDEQTVCRFFSASGKCYKGIKCDQLHVKPNADAFTEDKVEVCIDLPPFPLPAHGTMVCVQVVSVLSSCRFYAILPLGSRDLQDTFAETEEENLETMQIDLQREYDDSTNYYRYRVTLNPTASDIVIARCPDDNKWCRGRVMEEMEDDTFGIFFVDFGICRRVPLKDICSPLPRFTHLPTQAVEMFLNGVDKTSNSDQARAELARLTFGKDLVARIVDSTPNLVVDLYDTTGKKQIDVVQEMVRRKVVRPGHLQKSCSFVRGHYIAG